MWSNMWSKPLLCRFLQSGEIPQTQASQGFAAFRLTLSRIPPRHSQTRRDTNFAIPGYSISAIIPRRGRKSKIFLSVVIPVVKAAFLPFSATGGNPANAGVARLCGVSPCPVPDTATALPKQARYQLRYTRLLSYSIRLVVFSQTTRATNCATPGCEVSADSNGICQWPYLYPDLYIIH